MTYDNIILGASLSTAEIERPRDFRRSLIGVLDFLVLVLEHPPQYLSGCALRQRFDEPHAGRYLLVRRHSFRHERLHVCLAGGRPVRVKHDVRQRRLACPVVRHADDSRVHHGRVRPQKSFQLGRRDLENGKMEENRLKPDE